MDREYLKDSVIMAGIAGGFAFFSSLAGFAVAQIRTDPVTTLIAASVAAGTAFFLFLAGRMLPGPVVVPKAPVPP